MSVAITMHVTPSECSKTQTKTNNEVGNYAGSMLLSFRDSDTDASMVMFPHREFSLIA